MLLFTPFYRRFGVRRAEALAKPRMSSVFELALPRSSILHYLPESFGKLGPDNDYMMFRNIRRPVFLSHVTQLSSREGNPIQRDTPIAEAITTYHQRHIQFKRVKTLDFLANDHVSHLMVGYGALDIRYRYLANVMRNYNVWYNKTATLMDQANQLAQALPHRNQFIPINLPQTIPLLSRFLQHERTTVQRTLRDFDTSDKLMLLHLWRFFGTERQESVFNRIDPKHYDRINLIFNDAGRWYVMNLGRINKLRAPTNRELDAAKELALGPDGEVLDKDLKASYDALRRSTGLQPLSLAKLMLTGWLKLLAQRTKGLIVDEANLADTEEDDANIQLANEEQDLRGSEDEDDDDESDVAPPPNDTRGTGAQEWEDEDEDQDDQEELENLLLQIDEDLELAETQASESTDSEQATSEPEPPKYEDTYEGNFAAIVDQYAAQGQISPAQQRRLLALSKTYQDLKAPDGTPLDEFLTITPESLEIQDPPPNPKAQGLFNAAYTTSTLNTFDQQYVNQVMERDLANMVLSIQNAGFAVREYNMEEVRTHQDHYRSYTVVVTGLDGSTQTLRFQIPVVDRNGTYRVNGVKYFTPKQQGFHLPIKKITDTRVSLTSYYGKLFVFKPRIRVANYEEWLATTIRRYADMDTLTVKITQVILMDVMVPRPSLPRSFTALAKKFRSFTVTTPEGMTWDLNFEYTPEKYQGADASIEIGRSGDNVLYMLANSSLRVVAGNQDVLATYPSIEDFLNLDTKRMPVEYAALTIMGKEIPVGFIIAFRMGLKRFLSHFNITHRYVLAGQRNNLGPTEYAIAFNDKTLILDKANIADSLLVGGFTKYHRSLRKYNIEDFDRQDIFLNVLEDNEISSRFINEITLLYRMFVDPITKEILEDMGEPTTFEGLLPRAVELLRTDYVPIVKDRVRGYERFPGAFYTELVRSLRVQGSQSGRARNPLDFNPYAVHRAIMGDSAKMQRNDINPIEDLRQQESLKYGGTGGRSADTMMADDRRYEDTDEGLVSEASVDSGNVAANAYSAYNPKFNSVRGTYDTFDLDEDDVSRLISTSMLVSPGADTDDN